MPDKTGAVNEAEFLRLKEKEEFAGVTPEDNTRLDSKRVGP